MTTAHVFIGTSLDGFIARGDGDIGWLTRFDGRGEDHGYDKFFASMDAIVLGRHTYQKVLTFGAWPYGLPALVVSNTLTNHDVPPELSDRVQITRGKPAEILEEAAARGWRRVYVDGGKLIQSFLRAGLVADMIVSRVPVLIGDGLPLFGPLDEDVLLDHMETRAFPSGLVQSRYAVAA